MIEIEKSDIQEGYSVKDESSFVYILIKNKDLFAKYQQIIYESCKEWQEFQSDSDQFIYSKRMMGETIVRLVSAELFKRKTMEFLSLKFSQYAGDRDKLGEWGLLEEFTKWIGDTK